MLNLLKVLNVGKILKFIIVLCRQKYVIPAKTFYLAQKSENHRHTTLTYWGKNVCFTCICFIVFV